MAWPMTKPARLCPPFHARISPTSAITSVGFSDGPPPNGAVVMLLNAGPGVQIGGPGSSGFLGPAKTLSQGGMATLLWDAALAVWFVQSS